MCKHDTLNIIIILYKWKIENSRCLNLHKNKLKLLPNLQEKYEILRTFSPCISWHKLTILC